MIHENDRFINVKKLIFESFINEIKLESHIAGKFSIAKEFIPFKVLQLSSIFRSPNFFYFFFLFIFCLYVFLLQFIIGFLFLVSYPVSIFFNSKKQKNLIITSKSYHGLMTDAIAHINLSENDFIYARILNLMRHVRHVRLASYFFFLIRFTKYVILNSKQKLTLFLFYKDLLKIYLLSAYILDNPEIIVLTEDHYQRHAFICSNLDFYKFVIVQHGFIDDSIVFPFKFGKIDNLVIRDNQFLKSFEKYYQVINHNVLLRNPASLFSSINLTASCFLASSSPFIDSEIKFVEFFKNNYDIKLIIKKHPRHVYNSEKLNTLLSFSDELWVDDYKFPNSLLFVSHSSFLEFDFKSAGSHTFRLSNYSNVLELFDDPGFIRAILLV